MEALAKAMLPAVADTSMTPDQRIESRLRSTPWSARSFLLLAGVTAAALALRLYRLDAESLWMDELTTVETYYLAPGDIITAAAGVGQPPLDNLLGGALARTGLADSDWWVRFPAALFGAGAVLLLGWWVGRFAGPVAGITAAGLLAVCPLHVCLSQEARPYAAFIFFTLAAIVAFERARSRNGVGPWILFSALLCCLLMVRWVDPHFIAVSLAIYALGAFLLGRRKAGPDARRRELAKLWASATAILGAYAACGPFIGIVFVHSRRAVGVNSIAWHQRVADHLWESFSAVFSGHTWRTVFTARPGSALVLAAAGALAAAGLLVLLAKAVRRREPATALFIATMFPFPFAFAAVFAIFGNATPKPQYLLLGGALLLPCIAVTADSLRHVLWRAGRSASWAAFAVVLAVVAVPMTRASVASLREIEKRDWRGAMGYLRTHARPGDAAVSLASDIVPPTYTPMAFGKSRYGPEFLKIVGLWLTTPLDTFSTEVWARSDNTVWILVYTDRLYRGYDHVQPPRNPPASVRLHAFNGLFLVEIPAAAPAVERLMDGIALLYDGLPDRRSFIAPGVLQARYLLTRGDTDGAREAAEAAVRQCRNQTEARILRRDHLAALLEPEGSVAAAPGQ